MNIFYLDENPKICAQLHVSKHVVKMVTESAQILSTAHRVLDADSLSDELLSILYKQTHKNHPSTVWCRSNDSNYRWLYNLFIELCDEYTYRYGKIHKSDTRLREVLKNPPKNISIGKFYPPPQCMPDEYKSLNTIEAYQNYYNGAKQHILSYTGKVNSRPVPSWIKLE